MPRKFPLATVLRLREAEEEQAEQRLQLAARHLREVNEAIDRARGERRRQSDSLAASLAQGMNSTEILWLQRCLRSLDTALQQLEVARHQAEQLFQHHQMLYHQAHQRREILTTLRQNQRQAALAEEQRREQQQQDELYLLRKHSE